jgi:hypothetical protein
MTFELQAPNQSLPQISPTQTSTEQANEFEQRGMRTKEEHDFF